MPGLVLAAGEGRRFRADGGHGPKVLALWRERPLLAHVLDAAVDAGLDPILVVVGSTLVDQPALAAVLRGRPSVEVIVNANATAGLAASLAAGIAHLTAENVTTAPRGCVVLVGDQPGIEPSAIEGVVAAWRRTGRPARARYSDGAGHPVLLPAGLWPALPETGDVGARDVLNGLEVSEIAINGASPRDIDTLSDLDALPPP